MNVWKFNVSQVSIVDYVLRNGADPNKVLLGFPTYGHTYLLSSTPSNGKYIPARSLQTFPGPWTGESGFIGYNEVILKHILHFYILKKLLP